MNKKYYLVAGFIWLVFFSNLCFGQSLSVSMTPDETVGSSPFTVQFFNQSSGANSFVWDFGNGNVSSLKNPSNVYFQPGVYNVKLIGASTNGERDSVIAVNLITVLADPVAKFVCEKKKGCVDNTFEFKNESLNGDNYLWDFGDGSTTVLPNPNHTYNASGKYTVKLIAYNSGGKPHLETKVNYIQVFLPEISDFTVDKTIACDTKEQFSFSSNFEEGTNASWDFGDGNTSNDTNPVHKYLKGGVFSVSLTTIDMNGCRDSVMKSDYISLSKKQTPTFTSNTLVSCTNSPTNFGNTSDNSKSWVWDFGDSTNSTAENPSHTYTQVGDYAVTLTIKDNNGCEFSALKQKIISVQENGVAHFDLSQYVACSPSTVGVSNLSEGTVSYFWDFGDGETSKLKSPAHTFYSNGTFNVKLHAKSKLGCEAVYSKLVTLTPVIANFTADKTPSCAPLPISFSNLSLNASSYEWCFGDGAVSKEKNPSHTYELPGNYTVKLISINQMGCSDTLEVKDFIHVNNTVSNYVAPLSIEACTPLDVNFSSQTDAATSWLWNFGDGDTSSLESPFHTYSKKGTYNVSLLMKLKGGCTQYYPSFRSFDIKEAAIAIELLKDSCPIYGASFANVAGEKIASCVWDFGDGNISTEISPVHKYERGGYYTVKYSVIDSIGCKADIALSNALYFKECNSENITMSGYLGPLDILIKLDTAVAGPGVIPQIEKCLPFSVSFYDVYEQAVSWYWDFGDGSSSIVENPVHQYVTKGIFDVLLIIKDAAGEYKRITFKEYVVAHESKTNFSVEKDNECIKTKFSFKDKSPSATSWLWEFGDEHTATIPNTFHEYQNYVNSYTVQLTTKASNGCSSSLNSSLLFSKDKPVIWVDNYLVCSNTSAKFHCSSSLFTDYLWDFGDGTTSDLQNPSHVYKLGGRYQVSLSVKDNKGCLEKFLIPNPVINHDPQANFEPTVGKGCESNLITLKNLSKNTSLPLASHSNWDFGDGKSSEWTESPQHKYVNAGTYKVTLIVNQDSSCFDTLSKTVIVSPLEIVNFSTNKKNYCLPIKVEYKDASTSAVSWFWEFGDGNTSTLQNPTHTFTTFPKEKVKLTIISSNNCTLIAVKDNIKPFQAGFVMSETAGCAPLLVSFSNESANTKNWEWDFGDGFTSKLENPKHVYQKRGKYQVKLVAGHSFQCADTVEVQYVSVNEPIARFRSNNQGGCSPAVVSFSDTSFNTTSWEWNFGDGSKSEKKDPEHIYSVPGVYSVELIAKNESCRDTLIKNNYVTVTGSIAAFGVVSDTFCLGSTLSFMDSSINASSWKWNFGDGSSSSESNPIHEYNTSGEFIVSLKVSDGSGCYDHYKSPTSIVVNPSANALFEVKDSVGCLNDAIVVTNQSSNASEFLWDFGDNTSSKDSLPIKSYLIGGDYKLMLIANNVHNCADTSSNIFVSIAQLPDAEFNTEVFCPGYSTKFIPTSEFYHDWKYSWKIKGREISSEYSPLSRFENNQELDVLFRVENKHGCTDSVKNNIVISQPNYINIKDVNLTVVSVVSDSTTSISWNQSKSENFGYYVLYRQSAERKSFFPISKITDVQKTSFIDYALNTLKNSYCYKIRAFDDCERAMNMDSLAEHCTINVEAKVFGDDASIEWNPYVGATPESYSIYRTDEKNITFIKTVPFDVLGLIDSSFNCSDTFSYKIKANGLGGSSLFSLSDTSKVLIYTIDTNSLKVNVVRSTVIDDRSTLTEWAHPTLSHKKNKGYVIQRSLDNVNFSIIDSVEVFENSYIDEQVDVHVQNYYYMIKVIESCNTPYTVLDKSSSILLSKGIEDGRSILTCSKYEGWDNGVDFYMLQKINDEGVWESIQEFDFQNLTIELE